MQIIRYEDPQGAVRYAARQPDGSARQIAGDILGAYEVTPTPARVKKLLAPVAPVALFCIGLNYRRHAEEGKAALPAFPVLFMKSPAAVQNPGDPIELPRHLRSDKVDFECELAVVIGRRAKNVSRADALDYVLGYTCANDVSARDWQGPWGGSQWCRGKTFDTFAPLGPCLVLKDEIPDPAALKLRTLLNGQVMQDWRCDDMLFDVPTLISFLSGSTTLLPGTVILTGTPHGVGFARKPPVFLQPGDRVTIEIDRIGALTNPVVEEGGEFPPPRTPRRDPAG
ncbi:MAG TPA: fumarylacetoacetate hydrolase family protein [Verrucomicrobiota bacterium]|jgi:2-keto-4-pentenoate hydratase/2-oxohepta-3-ene-1,7-dioic acid hydratase in catechol pathway|nr:fumarylacetoacetate hydrolase family protein [Verrucomicrobiota bacterium]OQC25633.1 MAG: Ureidoglycolate lyase [Verrucomicrobia bacterium ADurb.Bin063]HRR63211.1 fumarylacetoacetate hydrolase family protein [Candidatus Paceibacterota bacterium]MBP8014346.1 fumarylacetoacetate hydrolase family protein [Verrucomicrobiota bacterium]MDI9371571.1 fumarylacetoacetate hydrolase family protein [Verrucomicrobiota bacterium]